MNNFSSKTFTDMYIVQLESKLICKQKKRMESPRAVFKQLHHKKTANIVSILAISRLITFSHLTTHFC